MRFLPNLHKLQFKQWGDAASFRNLLKGLPRPILIVHGTTFVKIGGLDWIGRLFESLKAEIECIQIEGEPTVQKVLELEPWNCQSKTVVGIGSGSVLDLAKLLSLHFESKEHFEKHLHPRSEKLQKGSKSRRLVLLPSNFSSGSFVSPSMVFRDEKEVLSVFSTDFQADEVIIQTDLCSNMSEELFKTSCVDPLAHFLDIFLGLQDKEFLLKASLGGWWQQYHYELAQKPLDLKNLYLLSSFLVGGHFPTGRMQWPLHQMAHQLSLHTGQRHCQTLLALLPPFLEVLSKEDSLKNLLREIHTFLAMLGVREELDRNAAREVVHHLRKIYPDASHFMGRSGYSWEDFEPFLNKDSKAG